MDLINVVEKINSIIQELSTLRDQLEVKGRYKAEALAHYDMMLSKTIIQLKNGKEFELDGEIVKYPLTTIIEKIAKGICWNEALKKDRAEIDYKNLIESIEIVKSQLNALQSINKNLSVI